MKIKSKYLTALLSVLALCAMLLAGCNTTSENIATPTTEPSTAAIAPTDAPTATPSSDKVLLVVSFGTSYNDNRDATIGAIETALQEAFPDYQVRRAFTSQIIMDKLYERDGLKIDNVTQAMDRLVLDRVKDLIILPTHIMNGYEYDDIVNEVIPYAGKFESFKIGSQLLNTDADYTELAEALTADLAEYEADDTAIVLMGHGTHHEANATYAKFQETLDNMGKTNYIVGTVEGTTLIEDVVAELKSRNATKVVMFPLMVVAGDHANNDMAGTEEDSWNTILTAEGYEVQPIIKGLGQIEPVHDIYIKHVQAAMVSENVVAPEVTDAPVAITNNELANGTYSIEVESSSSMFNIVAAELTVADGEMSAVVTLSGDGYGMLYMGTGEQALIASEADYSNFVADADGMYTYAIPVAALDTELDCAAWSIKNEQWYDRTITFKSTTLKPLAEQIADGSYTANASLIGGSGKASITSPTAVNVTAGAAIATVEWSSSNYEYMIVNDVQYLPVNTEGNSTFEIPVVLDEDMPVIACTNAMGSAREIEYTLKFEIIS